MREAVRAAKLTLDLNFYSFHCATRMRLSLPLYYRSPFLPEMYFSHPFFLVLAWRPSVSRVAPTANVVRVVVYVVTAERKRHLLRYEFSATKTERERGRERE